MSFVHMYVFVLSVQIVYSGCACRLDVDSHVGLPNFDNFLSSFLLVFQV